MDRYNNCVNQFTSLLRETYKYFNHKKYIYT